MTARRVIALAVLGAALLVAFAAFASVGVRLQAGPTRQPASAASRDAVARAGALGVFVRPQTSEESTDAAALQGLGITELTSIRELGRIEGLRILVWRTRADEVCLGLHRAGDAQPVAQCARASDFADGGVAVHWPDSPDLGPFDVVWHPDGRLTVASTLEPLAPSASP
jgi:hypothetical protein